MKALSRIAILGGGGRTGKYLVTELLQQQHPVKLLLRAPEKLSFHHPLMQIAKGDACDPAAIRVLLAGCDAIISTLGQRPGEPLVARQATLNVINAMSALNIRRYILLGGINIDTPFDKKGHDTRIATEYMKSNFPAIQEDRQNAYTLLKDCDLDWTLVRVPLIEFSDTRYPINVSTEDCPGKSITAGNIAGFLSQQLKDKRYFQCSPFLANA